MSQDLDLNFDPPGRPPTLYAFSASGSTLSFLSSNTKLIDNNSSNESQLGNTEKQLCAISLTPTSSSNDIEIVLLVDSSAIGVDTEANLSLEEKLRRERMRLHATGVTSVEWAKSGNDRILFPLLGNIYVQDGRASARCVYDKNLFNDASVETDETFSGVVGRDKSAVDPHLSPNGQMVAFVIAGELFTVPATNSVPNANLTRITFGAKENGVLHGLADFIAMEEMDRYRGFWWSPDSSGVAFAEVDEKFIPEFRINHSGKPKTDSSTFEDHKYPFAGEKNPAVRLGFVSVVSSNNNNENWKNVRFFSPPLNSSEYLARVNFLPDNTICAQWENREQSVLNLVRINPYGERENESKILLTEVSLTQSPLAFWKTRKLAMNCAKWLQTIWQHP